MPACKLLDALTFRKWGGSLQLYSADSVSAESLKSLAAKAGLVIKEKNVDDFRTLLTGVDQAAKLVLESEGKATSKLGNLKMLPFPIDACTC
jgi:hypothetical protein